MCQTLKLDKLSKNIEKIGIFTVYKAKIGQNGLFWTFSSKYFEKIGRGKSVFMTWGCKICFKNVPMALPKQNLSSQ